MKYKMIARIGIIVLSCSTVLTACGVNEVSNLTEVTSKVSLEETLNGNSDDLEIKEVYIDIEEDDWEAILDAPLDEEYYSVDVTVDDETVTDAGFRTKGNSSLSQVASSDSERYGFRVKLDKYNDDGEVCGTNEFVLNGSFSDPSYMREYITYMAVAELGGITPDVSYANLYINDTYYGLYLYVEAYDDTFVENISNAEDTTLYKADGERCTLTSSSGTSGFEVKYGDDDEMENLDFLIEALESAEAGDYSVLEEVLDVDSVLQAMTINYLCGNYDSYSGDKAHNYYLLYSEGEFTYIGWDYNMAFGGYAGDNGASLSVDADVPLYNSSLEERPLFAVMLENEEYVARYEEYLEELATYLGDWENIVAEIEDEIDEYVAEDPTAFYTYEEFKENLELTGIDYSSIESSGKSSNMSGDISKQETGEIPERMEMADGEIPEGMEMPEGERTEGMEIPEGMEMPNGELPGGNRDQGRGEIEGDITEEEFAEIMQKMPEGMMDSGISGDVISLADYISNVLENYESTK